MMHHAWMRRVRSIPGLSVLVVACVPLACAAGDYQRDLEEYTVARQRYEEVSEAHWNLIAEKRRARIAKHRNNEAVVIDDYVLTQPPVYSGPPKPMNPAAPA